MANRHAHVYVSLERDEDGYPPFDLEEVDAIGLGDGQFRIGSTPAFVYGLARGDVVRASKVMDDNRLWVTEVLASSENWVARVKPRKGCEPETVISRFTALGCKPQLTRYGLVTIDVPPEADAAQVLDELHNGQEQAESWYFDLGVAPFQ